MVAILLLQLALAAGRVYHEVPLERLAKGTRWPHVCTEGPVVYVRLMADTDWHVTLDNGQGKVVVEIVVELPIQPPKKGQTVRACGWARWDPAHKWQEIHPATSIEILKATR